MFANDWNSERQPAGVDCIHVAHRQVMRRLAAKIERVQDKVEPAARRAPNQRRGARAREQVALVIVHEQVHREREKNSDGDAKNQNHRFDFVEAQIAQREKQDVFHRLPPAAKSRQLMTRGKRAAISVSCVTISKVAPVRSICRKRRSTTCCFAEGSRLPVGSSASNNGGSGNIARQMATRCFSPCDRRWGKYRSRCVLPVSAASCSTRREIPGVNSSA